jgi:predicted ester cyclase
MIGFPGSQVTKRKLWLAIAAIAATAACSGSSEPPTDAATSSAEARVRFYRQCWEQFNNKAWDEFQNCYADNATFEGADGAAPLITGRANIIEHAKAEVQSVPDRHGELRLILVNGQHIAGIAAYMGTNTGPLPPGPDGKETPATGKPFGLLMGHAVDLDAAGAHAVRDLSYLDVGTWMAQLGLSPIPARPVEAMSGAPATVVTAKNDETETANLAAARAMYEAVNKHDVAAIDAMTPDDYRMIEMARPADVGRKESLEGTREMFAAFPDVAITPVTMWAAGDYVVVEGTFEGTNTGDMPSMGLTKTGKHVSLHFMEVFRFVAGKPTDDWLFYNSAAWMQQLGLQ